jgi:aryl-alcohol dehydrogenase-like predicted oxidoreductase
VLAQGNDIVPIPGTTRRNHLDENIAAVQITLTEKELDDINNVIPKDAVSGLRYPESGMKMVNL